LNARATMTIQEEILKTFYERLAASEAVSKENIDDLRGIFQAAKKLKADDFVAVLAKKAAGDTV
jgi:hypothetical protein